MSATPRPKRKPAAKPDVEVEISPRELANYRRDLRAVTRRANAREAAAEEGRSERDRVIRDALSAGVPIGEIAQATGLSQPRVWQIRRGTRL